MAKTNPLVSIVRRQVETDPEALARTLESLPEDEVIRALHELPAGVIARALPYLQVGYAATLLASSGPDVFAAIAEKLEPERAAQVFARLPEEVRERFVPHIPERIRSQVCDYLTYPESSVGKVMSTRYITLLDDLLVREAMAKLRRMAKGPVPHSYTYVIDGDGRLIGVLSAYDLIVGPSGVTVGSLARADVYTVDPFDDQNAVAEELAKRRFFAAPVVDSQRHLLGIVKAEQLMAGVKGEISQDIQKMFGVGAHERAFSPMRFSMRTRLPWLLVNLGTAFLAASVVSMFEGVIAKVTALAVFLPVVAGQGGNAGAQSLAIVMRGLVMREIPRDRVGQLIRKETWLGVVNGTLTGIVTAAVAWLWMGNPMLGLVIGLGMIVNLTFAGLAGASIPIGMKKLGLDPAQCSSIMLTTVTDVIGFFAFLGFAVVFQSYLV